MGSNWKRNVMKSKQARGEEYINSAKKLIQKKTTGPNCHCRNKCLTKVDDTHKQDILEQLYSTRDKTRQDIYLGGLISMSKVQSKRPTTGEEREENGTYKYKVCCQNIACVPHCVCTCGHKGKPYQQPFQCTSHLFMNDVRDFHSAFYQNKDKRGQDLFILHHIDSHIPVRQRKRTANKNKPKSCILSYKLKRSDSLFVPDITITPGNNNIFEGEPEHVTTRPVTPLSTTPSSTKVSQQLSLNTPRKTGLRSTVIQLRKENHY
ncbi:unnamed protein product [Diabrotica balteata]|uniref:Uncharacterized protein n=1 Tax=Diabrotica balteata TaxID=107213 RepID=A0A9N9T554_DIABA|nr:unnamed protein product [Diabrotica balteata]